MMVLVETPNGASSLDEAGGLAPETSIADAAVTSTSEPAGGEAERAETPVAVTSLAEDDEAGKDREHHPPDQTPPPTSAEA